QRALDLAVAIRRRQHNNSRVRKFSANCDQDIGSVGARKAQVHQGDVGAVATKFGDRFDAVGGLPDENHIWLSLQDCGKPLAKDRMIFDTQDANLAALRHDSYSAFSLSITLVWFISQHEEMEAGNLAFLQLWQFQALVRGLLHSVKLEGRKDHSLLPVL